MKKYKIGFLFVLLLSILFANGNNASAATVTSKTPSEVVEYLRADMENNSKKYGAGLCLKYISDVYGKMGFDTRYGLGSAIEYWYILEDEGDTHYDPLEDVPIGADVFFDSGTNFGSTGHVGIYIGNGTIIHNRTIYNRDGSVKEYGVVEQYIADNNYYTSCYLGWAWHDWVTIKENDDIDGKEMTVGYDRVLPDGDYIIAASADPHYFLDITGTALPAADHDNVALYYVDNLDSIAAADIWTITYDNSNKFYKIKQKGSDMCLDVAGSGKTAPTNVQVFHDNNEYKTHYWAISLAGEKGYRIESRSGTFSLDMSTGLGSGVNVRQWKKTESEDEKWLFIPYKPNQPVGEDRYIIQLARDPSFELTVADNNNVRLWDDTAPSQSNSFDLIKLLNGYYKIKHVASGKCLDVKNAAVETSLVDVILANDNGTLAQQWAIVENGTGYSLISRCNGYVLHLSTGNVVNGTNIDVSRWYFENNALNQKWSFAKAEQRVCYNAPKADGGIPAEQIKYYKSNLKLSEQIPTMTGYQFLYWEDLFSLNENLECDRYYPGDIYTADKALELYAVWKQLDYTVSYDANGGSGAPAAQHFTTATATLSSDEPFRPHHRFLGWASSSTATVVEYLPGSEYSGTADITLYAVWERVFDNFLVLPGALNEIESEAFLNINADAVVIPRTVTSIGKNAFDDVAIYGYAGTAAETYASTNGMMFIPITDDWVLASDVPAGAHVIEEEWRYRRVTDEYDWVEKGSGVRKFASFPSGFDRGNAIYQKYENGGALGEVVNNNTKKVYGDQSLLNYIFWHWTYSDEYANHEVETYESSDGRHDYYIFHAFETTDPLNNRYGMTSSGEAKMYDGIWSTYHYPEYSEYGPWWWYRFEVYQQPYTQYEKVFRTAEERSATPVSPSDTISNVQHWVRYSF